MNRQLRRHGAAGVMALLFAGCGSGTPSPPADPGLDAAWVDETLAGMSLAQQAAQLVFARLQAVPGVAEHDAAGLAPLVEELGLGGVVLFRSSLDSVPAALDRLQEAASVPLLVAADLERGLAFRIPRGATSLPYAMAIGAAGSIEGARFAGAVTAREARALGIHWVLAPVADLNSDPDNPVIHLRSFGEDPEAVGTLVAAFVEGAREVEHEGHAAVLTAVKHFPGHGATGVDSHHELPVLAAGHDELAARDWVPFRSALAAGADAVMVGHVAVPAIDPGGVPASLSPLLTGEVLRGEWGFEGLIVTDALEMKGLRPAWTGEAAVRAVAAGADVVLLPDDPRVAVQSLVRAVDDGRLAAGRIRDSARRILAAKARLGLQRPQRVDRAAMAGDIGRPEDRRRAELLAAAGLTLVRDDPGILPLPIEQPLRLLLVELFSDPRDSGRLRELEEALEDRLPLAGTLRYGPAVDAPALAAAQTLAHQATHVLVAADLRVAAQPGPPAISPGQRALLARLRGSGRPLIFTALQSPYVLSEVPDLPTTLVTWGPAEPSQRALAAALSGERPIRGKLPVTLPGVRPRGHGLVREARPMRLQPSTPREAGFDPGRWQAVEQGIEDAVMHRAFPGAVIAVGHDGRLVGPLAFGRLSYGGDAAPVTADTLYDLASLTKVVATTTMAMILVEEGRLDLDKPVRDFLPAFHGGAKDRVTVRQLLTHSSGIDWWAPLYEEPAGRAAVIERITALPLAYEPGSQSVYSDLGILLLGEILERVAGRSLEEFVTERVFEPLGMENTVYRPDTALLPRIAPTEEDPWRGRVVHGEVHDENAAMLGGVAPHAGLFGTAGDLARFAQMLLDGGFQNGHRILRRETIEQFTRPAGVPDSTRALGWDTPSETGSSAGSLFSRSSFGHTGFTGTSLWIDPERRLFVLLLSNRVHPTRENQLIREVRPALADAVVRALAAP